jgi:hypothetical protein
MLLTLTQVAKETGLSVQTVRRRADTVWRDFVTRSASGHRQFTCLPTRERHMAAGGPPGVQRNLPVQPSEDQDERVDLKNARPVTPIDWALHWQDKGLILFPCSRFLGDPLLANWYAPANRFGTGGACKGQTSIVSWWTQWPDADIAAVPWRSNHFVIVAVREEGGYESLQKIRHDLPKIDFEHWAPWGEHHLWFKTSSLVQSSSHRLGRGLHVVGPGRYVFLPNSRSPFIA